MDTNFNGSPETSHHEPLAIDFEFRGSGFEFFKIWIVNIVLTILTLGIFSAWAKVRARRYLYGNTYLAGHNFEYLADPIKILKGRLVVAGVFGLYVGSGYVHYSLPLVFLFLLVALTPYILVKSLAFNLAYTTYRNLSFSLQKDYKEAYKRYVIWGLVTVFTLYLGFPAALRRFYDYLFNRVKYGDTGFTFKNSESLYPIYIGAFFLQLALAVGLALIAGGVVFLAQSLSSTVALTGASSLIQVGAVFAILTFYGTTFYTYAVVRTWTLAYLSRQLFIDDIRLISRLAAGELGMINFSNFLLIVFTLGLGTPWALIRYRKHFLEHLSLQLPSAQRLDEFFSSKKKSESAEGDAAADIFDVELDIGL